MLSSLAQTTFTTTSIETADSGMSFATIFILFLGVWIVSIVAFWKLFEKAGIPGWKAIIPIYNTWLLMEMAGKPGWWGLIPLLGAIPVIGIFASFAYFVMYIVAALELGKAFGKSTTFSVVGLIIFSLVGLMILGFGKDEYNKPATAPENFA